MTYSFVPIYFWCFQKFGFPFLHLKGYNPLPWHVYYNPEYPENFTYLYMACHLIFDPTIINGQCHLFEGLGQYERFNIIFLEIVGHPKYHHLFIALGMPPEDFETHSIIKGVVTFVATRCTTRPPISSICFRAN